MGLLEGMEEIGLGSLDGVDLYADQESNSVKAKQIIKQNKPEEKELIYDKKFLCPVCNSQILSKVMKTGKTRQLSSDLDLRITYEGIDASKYEVCVCKSCGYAALTKFFPDLADSQTKLIKEKITGKVQLHDYHGEIYSYEQAMERYRLALACAVVKHAKASEKGYTCLKGAWLLRGWQEEAHRQNAKQDFCDGLARQEKEYLNSAFKGFWEARKSETFPICGMNQDTLDYLLAALATELEQYDAAAHLVAQLLVSRSANTRIKDKARDLKEMILPHIRKN